MPFLMEGIVNGLMEEAVKETAIIRRRPKRSTHV
jgi:hypothetical protein